MGDDIQIDVDHAFGRGVSLLCDPGDILGLGDCPRCDFRQYRGSFFMIFALFPSKRFIFGVFLLLWKYDVFDLLF